MFSHTIAIARCLLAEGRTSEVEEMIAPLLQEVDSTSQAMTVSEQNRVDLLRCLLAQSWLLSQTKSDEAISVLEPLAEATVKNKGSIQHALSLLWLGWAHILVNSRLRDIPYAIHLLKSARKHLEHLQRGDYLYWSHIGLALALSRMSEYTQMDEILHDVGTCTSFAQDALAKRWTESLVSDRAPTHLNATQNLMYASYDMRPFMNQCSRIAEGSAPALLTGERGAGKEISARLIHEMAGCNPDSFQCIDCEAISSSPYPEPLPFLSETKPPRTVDTIFFNHIEALPTSLQDRLLSYWSNRSGSSYQSNGPRLIAATSANLLERVDRGQFNRDLYHILQINTLNIPSLRSRASDIPLLVLHYAHVFCPRRVSFVAITEEALTAMLRYSWPGNMRQLRNEMERAIVLVSNEPVPVIDLRTLPSAIKQTRQNGNAPQRQRQTIVDTSAEQIHLEEILASTEKHVIEQVLASNKGQVSTSASYLGLTRQGLYKKIKRLGITVSRFQEEEKRESSELLS